MAQAFGEKVCFIYSLTIHIICSNIRLSNNMKAFLGLNGEYGIKYISGTGKVHKMAQ